MKKLVAVALCGCMFVVGGCGQSKSVSGASGGTGVVGATEGVVTEGDTAESVAAEGATDEVVIEDEVPPSEDDVTVEQLKDAASGLMSMENGCSMRFYRLGDPYTEVFSLGYGGTKMYMGFKDVDLDGFFYVDDATMYALSSRPSEEEVEEDTEDDDTLKFSMTDGLEEYAQPDGDRVVYALKYVADSPYISEDEIEEMMDEYTGSMFEGFPDDANYAVGLAEVKGIVYYTLTYGEEGDQTGQTIYYDTTTIEPAYVEGNGMLTSVGEFEEPDITGYEFTDASEDAVGQVASMVMLDLSMGMMALAAGESDDGDYGDYIGSEYSLESDGYDDSVESDYDEAETDVETETEETAE